MTRLTQDAAARLMRRSARRRADDSRGMRARRAWKRLVRACAAGDAAAQEAVWTAELPDEDVLELLAAGPEEPADRAAYLTLIGQRAQRHALDPDGAQLALAYWAATGEVRERLRAAMAAEGDVAGVRVVVGSEQRDRVAGMSYEELDHLGRRLAEHGRFDELRRLALDLPLAKAIAAARLLPPDRIGQDSGAPLAALAGWSPERLEAVVARLPRRTVIRHRKGSMRVSFSPDQAELAVSTTELPPETVIPRTLTERARLATGESRLLLRTQARAETCVHSILHLGDEIVRMESRTAYPEDTVSRVHPVHEEIAVHGPEILSEMGRASTGVVAVTVSGLVFVDRGSVRRRHVAIPRIAEVVAASPDHYHPTGHPSCDIATLPDHRLLAVTFADRVLVLHEDGTVLHDEHRSVYAPTFLAPDRLAVLPEVRHPQEQRYETWTLAESGEVRRDEGRPRGWAALEELRGFAMSAGFARWIVDTGHQTLRDEAAPQSLRDERGLPMLRAVSTYGDMFVISRYERPMPLSRYNGDPRARSWGKCEVHSPHLPSVHEVLDRPLLHSTPHLWRRIRELRARIGDPEVREVLGLLDTCLAERFGRDISLGTEPVAPGSGTDIALGDGGGVQ